MGVQSVLVQRILVLRSDESLFREAFRLRTPVTAQFKNLKSVVRSATETASPIVLAWGASDFELPPRSGMTGNYNERAIYVVEKSLDRLRAKIESKNEIEDVVEYLNIDKCRVYKGTIAADSYWGSVCNSAGEAWYVAFPDDYTVVCAETVEDISHMLKWLRAYPKNNSDA